MNLCVDCIQKNHIDFETEKSQASAENEAANNNSNNKNNETDEVGNGETTTNSSSLRKSSSGSTSSSDSFIDLNLEDTNLTKIRASGIYPI